MRAPWCWRISSHFDAFIDDTSFISGSDWAIAEVKTEVELAKVLRADTVRGTKIESITWIVQIELEILGRLECDVSLTSDMVSLRLCNAVFEVNVPESSLIVASFVEIESVPVDIRNEHIQVEVSTLEGNGISVDGQLVFSHVDQTRSKCLKQGVLVWQSRRKAR